MPVPDDRAHAPRLDALRETLARRLDAGAGPIRVVCAPYRVCPVGAHVDHQHGPVLAWALDRGTDLAFAAAPDRRCAFASRDEAGVAAFLVDAPGPAVEARGWERYPRAAAWALRDRLPARPRGVVAEIEGALPGGGLSSSASLLLACLTALAQANAIELAPRDAVRLSVEAENDYVGLRCGALDPAAIVAGRRGRLTRIETRDLAWERLAPGAAAPAWRLVVAFSGRTRTLTDTGFNARVAECRAAARAVAERTGRTGVERLGDLPEDVLAGALDDLPDPLARRARHFHEERRRVDEAAACWRAGDLEGFGRAMNDSCRSSIENFETGSPELVALHEALGASGAFGSRFSGAGFAGCAVGLVAAERAEACRDAVADAYGRAFPEAAERAQVLVAESGDGVRLV
jgi:galactokinase/galacturonokinase